MTSAERNYSSTEKECLAIVWAVLHLRPYLKGTRFVIRTDNGALKWLMNLKDPSGRLSRWALRLQEFDFEVQYKPGSSNTLAGGPSRLLTDGVDQSHFNDVIFCLPRNCRLLLGEDLTEKEAKEKNSTISDREAVCATRTELKTPIGVEETLAAQALDDYCRWARSQIAEGRDTPFVLDRHGVLTRKSRLDVSLQMVVPETLRKRLLDVAHGAQMSAHPGRSKMYQKLRRNFNWPSVSVDINQWVEDCESCARNRMKD